VKNNWPIKKESKNKSKLRPENKLPKVILKFEPSPYFEDEFVEFVEQVLSWKEEETYKK